MIAENDFFNQSCFGAEVAQERERNVGPLDSACTGDYIRV